MFLSIKNCGEGAAASPWHWEAGAESNPMHNLKTIIPGSGTLPGSYHLQLCSAPWGHPLEGHDEGTGHEGQWPQVAVWM